MVRLPAWKIGAVLGLLYGIFGWWIEYPLIIESPLILVIGPLYIVAILVSWPVSLFTDPSSHTIIIFPVSGLILGIIAGKGIDVVAGKMPKIDPWKKGAIIGFSIGVLGALGIALSPLIGSLLIGPLVYLAAAILKVILPAADMGSNLPEILLVVIILGGALGGIAGYLLGWEGRTVEKPEDSGHLHLAKHVAVAVIFLILVGTILVVSGFIQPAKVLAPHYSTSFGRMTVLASFPDSPATMTVYRVMPGENESVKIPEGTVEIIPASAAFEKLKNGDFQGNRLKASAITPWKMFPPATIRP